MRKSTTSSQRRFSKLAKRLNKLRQEIALACIRVRNGYVNNWVYEINSRAKAQHDEAHDEVIPAIFVVFEKANILAGVIDSQSNKIITDSLKENLNLFYPLRLYT